MHIYGNPTVNLIFDNRFQERLSHDAPIENPSMRDDLIGGHNHAMINSIEAVLPRIKSGKLRVLGTGGVKRSSILSDVPIIAEASLPGFNVTGWYGILAPAGTPAPIVERLNKEIKAILSSDEVKKRFLNAGMEADYLRRSSAHLLKERLIAGQVL
jgi:tripartite-type tricarboxylate transporter receptor subunit TctC